MARKSRHVQQLNLEPQRDYANAGMGAVFNLRERKDEGVLDLTLTRSRHNSQVHDTEPDRKNLNISAAGSLANQLRKKMAHYTRAAHSISCVGQRPSRKHKNLKQKLTELQEQS
jgi:hypothetical protein